MTSVAATIATHGHAAAGINGSGTNASPADDGFAAILGNLIQAPANDKATVAASTVQSDDSADTTSDTDSEAATDAAARTLQSLHPLQEIKPSANQACQPSQDGASDPGAVLVSLTQGASDGAAATPSTSLTGRGADASARVMRGAKSDPAQVASGDVAPDKPAVDANQAIDPILAQMAAAQQAVPATAAPAADSPTPAPAGVQSDPAQVAVDALSAPATDVVASSMTTGGATAKPAKPGAADDGKATADSEKTQTQGSTAATLADTAAARAFTDQRVSAAHALPLHVGSDASKNSNGQSGGSPSDQQKPGTTATPAATPAADVPAASTTNFTPAHAQTAAPQPEASAAANAAAANSAASVPAASVATNAPAQAATQLQVSHPAAAAPDINSLAFNIATKSEGGARHFDIRLDPAELGRVDVRLTVDDAGKAQATLSVEKPQTLELLQKDQGHLERALKDAGLDLSQNGLNFSLKGQQQQTGGNASSSRSRTLAVRAIAAADAAATNLSLGSAAASDTRLDIRV